MDAGLIIFILTLVIVVFGILSQAKDRSGSKIGMNAGRLMIYGTIYLGSIFGVGLISFLVPHLIGLEGSAAQATGIVIGLIGLFTAVPYVGEWIERREGARERK